MRTLALLVPAATTATASQALWGQCGGIGYQGSTSCTTGAVCTAWNPYYHQCVPGATTAAPPATTSPMTIRTSTTLTASTRTTSTSSTTTPTQTGGASGPKYFIAFGDSYSQTGFNINSTKPSASNPLGNPPLPGWTASGGYNWIGFLASPNHNFSSSNPNTPLLTYNFAYGGATTDASLVTPYAPTVLSFIDQVAQFSGSIASKPNYAPWTSENTLFGVWIGVNDVGNSWWLADYDQLVERIMDSYFGQIRVLYEAGARKFLVLSVPPIHLTPAVAQNGPEVQANEAKSIKKYNEVLASRLTAFAQQNAGVDARLLDTWAPFNKALENPTRYGAPNASCYNSDGVSCLWFNDYHPGVEINRLVAAAAADLWKGDFFLGGSTTPGEEEEEDCLAY
ncbi:putative endoglucanase type F [Rhypophila sp. PSN 637]